MVDERGLTKIVRDHDGGLQRGEVQRGNGLALEAFLGVDDGSSFEGLVA